MGGSDANVWYCVLVVVSFVYTSVKTHQIVHFKCVQFIVSQLYFDKAEKEKDP